MVADAAKSKVISQRVFRSTASNYVGRLVTLIATFLLTPFILRQLGATSYGLWALAGSVVAYSFLLELGIVDAVTKYVAEYRIRGQIEQARSLVSTALWLYSGLGFIAIILSAAIAAVFPVLFNVPPDERATATWLVLLMGFNIGISIPCTITMAVLRGFQRFDIVNLISVINTLLSVVAIIVVLLLGGGVLGMVAVNIPLTLLMQVPSIWLIKRIAPELRFGWRGASRSLVQTITSFSSSLFVVQIAGLLKTRTDEMVIATFLPINAITPYVIARRLSEVAQTLTDQFIKVLLPLASELHAENDRERLLTLYTTSTRLTLAIFLPIGCTIVILVRPLLTVWVGPEYAEYAQLTAILTLASFIDTSLWPAASVLQGMARHRPLAVISICVAIANIILSIALVRSFGLTGVALGTLIPITVEFACLVMPYAMRVFGVSITEMLAEIFLPALLPTVPMVIVLVILRQAVEPSSLLSIMVVAGIGLLVYVIGYLSVGASAIERQTYRSFALSAIHFAQACLKRS